MTTKSEIEVLYRDVKIRYDEGRNEWLPVYNKDEEGRGSASLDLARAVVDEKLDSVKKAKFKRLTVLGDEAPVSKIQTVTSIAESRWGKYVWMVGDDGRRRKESVSYMRVLDGADATIEKLREIDGKLVSLTKARRALVLTLPTLESVLDERGAFTGEAK